MITFKAESQLEFFKFFIAAQSLVYNFNSREAEVAVQFLSFRHKYLTDPLKIMVEELDEVSQEMEVVAVVPPMMEQLKNPITLNKMTKNIHMSFTVFRKHVAGLKEKEFFVDGDISPKFSTDGISEKILIKRK